MSRAVLPSGTVSMLFSDLEGSTTLVQSLGDRWGAVLDLSREACRSAWAAHEGVEMGTEGDSFFVVFASAGSAVAAAVAAQRGLAAVPWPPGVRVAARMGIHTGQPTRHGDGYIGVDLHLAARVGGAAHGGQVIVSPATVEAAGSLPEGVTMRDLGDHRLKNFAEPVRLFQLAMADLPGDFPPLRTRVVTGNLPQMATELVGREGEVAEVRSHLARSRLVTLTGPGGTGKTRLAVDVASRVGHDFPDGVFFVALAALSDAASMWSAVAHAVELPPESHTQKGVLTRLSDTTMLLVLDNLEQLAAADSVVRETLDAAPGLRVVATSRRPLHVAGEREHPVSPLVVPPVGAAYDVVAAAGSVEMFVDHARRVKPDFSLTLGNADDVAAICRSLDGLPLAIELTAARVKVLAPGAILARLDRVLDLAAADRSRPDRLRTLRQAIEWSHRLLPQTHQRLLAHLSVFAGGADLAAVEAVAPAEVTLAGVVLDVLEDLVDASFVTVVEDSRGEPRFVLLETIRRFARDELQRTGDADSATQAHAQHFYDLAIELRPRLLEDYHGASATFIRELSNFDEVANNADLRFKHPGYPPGSMASHEDAVARLVNLAFTVRLIARGVQWAETELAVEPPPDVVGRLALLAFYAFLVATSGDYERALELCAAGTALGAAVDLEATDVPSVSSRAHPRESLGVLRSVESWSCLNLRRLEQGRAAALAGLDLAGPLGPQQRVNALSFLLSIEEADHRWDLAADILAEIAVLDGSEWSRLWTEVRLTNVDLHDGRPGRAWRRLVDEFEAILALDDPDVTVCAAEHIMVAVGNVAPLMSARLLGAMRAHRAKHDFPISADMDLALATDLDPVRRRANADAWTTAETRGETEDLRSLMREALALDPGH